MTSNENVKKDQESKIYKAGTWIRDVYPGTHIHYEYPGIFAIPNKIKPLTSLVYSWAIMRKYTALITCKQTVSRIRMQGGLLIALFL